MSPNICCPEGMEKPHTYLSSYNLYPHVWRINSNIDNTLSTEQLEFCARKTSNNYSARNSNYLLLGFHHFKTR